MEFIDEFIDRKFGTKEVVYQHPILESILKETYGVIVYQEQVIQIANKVGGMSLAEADILRRAMGKKDLKTMKEQKEKFTAGAIKNGIVKGRHARGIETGSSLRALVLVARPYIIAPAPAGQDKRGPLDPPHLLQRGDQIVQI